MQAVQNIVPYYHTKTHNGQALRVPGDPRKEEAAQIIVPLKNRGDRKVEWEFCGKLYRLQSKSQANIICAMAWHILGDPDYRPGAVNGVEKGTVRTWSRQVADLQNMWGTHTHERVLNPGPGQDVWRSVPDPDSMWQYILDGHLYVYAKEHGFGRGKDYYTPPTSDYVRTVTDFSAPLEDDMDARVRHGYSQGKAVTAFASALEDDEDETDKFQPAAKPKK